MSEERVRELEAEVASLKAELAEALSRVPPKRTLKDYLLWLFWLALVMCLGAYLYSILAPAPETPAGPIQRIAVPRPGQDKPEPVKSPPPPPPEEPKPVKFPGF
ncbi:MAG: hypothetical protein WC728_09115 [Elusimicrobiota bacterium]